MDAEKHLMHRIQQRDSIALAELYDLYGGRVYSLTVTILGEGMAAQEVTQDTFMKVWQHPEQYHFQEGKFAAWLLTIARRSAIDRLRRDRRQMAQFEASLDDEHFPELHDLRADEEARWRDLLYLFGTLPHEQREVIELSYYRGLSQSDISMHINVPLGTVKTRMRLAMEKLRQAFYKASTA